MPPDDFPPLSRFSMTFEVCPGGDVVLSTARDGHFDSVYSPVRPGEALQSVVTLALAEVAEFSPARQRAAQASGQVRYWVVASPDGSLSLGWRGAKRPLVLTRAEAEQLSALLLTPTGQ